MKIINPELYSQRKGAIWLVAGVLFWSLILLWVHTALFPRLHEFLDWFWTRRYAGCITDALLYYSASWWLIPVALSVILVLVANFPRTGALQRVVVASTISVAVIACLLMTYALVEGSKMALSMAIEQMEESEPPPAGDVLKAAPEE
jgi:hypothetical protein